MVKTKPHSGTMKFLCLLLAQFVWANYLPSDFLGLARDFTYDVTVANHDRLTFTSQASGIQTFTFYSEGDLTDDLAFYLYGLWSWTPGQHWSTNQSGANFVLVKTKQKLPVERYDIIAIMDQTRSLTPAEQNIMNNLSRVCESLYSFILELRKERLRDHPYHSRIHENLHVLLPEMPSIFKGILAKAIEGFDAKIDEDLTSTSDLQAKSHRPVHLNAPADFHYTWQIPSQSVPGNVETATVRYDRGNLKILVDSTAKEFADLINAIRRQAQKYAV